MRAPLPLLALLLACTPEEVVKVYTNTDLESDVAGYEDWAHPAAWPGVQVSCEDAHGDYVEIWLNKIAVGDLDAGREEFSEGAVFVLVSYQDAHGTPKMQTAMRKVPDFAPALGDWYWGLYDEAGTLVEGGAMAACASCHEDGTDFVRHVGVTPPTSESECGRDDTGWWYYED